MRQTYMINGQLYSATSLNQATIAARFAEKAAERRKAKLENDAKLARTQYHAK